MSYYPYYEMNQLIPLEARDRELERMWEDLEDVPMNPDTECIEEPFMHFPAGTSREDLWRWFDQRHSMGVYYLLYGAEIDRVKVKRLFELGEMCDDCESKYCAYCEDGICKFPLVRGRKPEITEEDGCAEGVIETGW